MVARQTHSETLVGSRSTKNELVMTIDVPTQLRELAEVGALSFQRGKDDPVWTEFPKLAARLLAKREAHDGAIKSFATTLSGISDQVEVDLLHASTSITEALETVDGATAAIFAELDQDDLLVTKGAEYLTRCWQAIEETLKKRHAAIRSFGETLEGLEQARAASAGGELRHLVDTLLKIAFKSPGEIERVVESDAFELNAVIIANRKSHAELLALLEKQDVGIGLQAIESWRSRREAWRLLRHDRAVREFRETLESQAFVNPPSRKRRFDLIKAEQLASDDARQALLREVEAMTCPALASEKASEAKARFEAIHTAETTSRVDHERALDTLVEESHDAALATREDLRRELHTYGALSEEPDLATFANSLEAVALDPQREDFFRSAGGLKPELRQLVAELREDDIVYARVLDEAKRRLSVLRCGRELDNVLETQGKQSIREGLLNTLEGLRKAGRPEVPPLLPVLESQVDHLLQVEGLDDLLLSELAKAKEALQHLIEDIAEQSGEPKGTQRNSQSRRGSQSSKRGTATAYTGYEGPAINMGAVRNVQKTVAMLVSVCELDDDGDTVIELLEDVANALDMKQLCNEAVDAVVTQDCEAVIAMRHEEHLSLAKEVCTYLGKQSTTVCDVACKVCDFYVRVAKAVEGNHEKETHMDEAMEDDLFEIKEDQRLRNEATEETLRKECHNLRHAADDEALETAFSQVLENLTIVEAQYRAFHGDSTKKAREHPVNQEAEAARFEAIACELLGLHVQGTDEGGETYAINNGAARSVLLPLTGLVKAVLTYEAPEAEPPKQVTIEGDATEEAIAPAPAEEEEEAEPVNWYSEDFAELAPEEVAELRGRARDAYLDARDDAFLSGVKGLSEADQAEYEALVLDVEAHRAASIERRSKGVVSDTPVDGNEEACVEAITLPETRLVELLDTLRASVISDTEARSAKRRETLAALTEDRITAYTDELEERLRTHWPRKGRSEVSFRQPREGELIAHRQRKERHLRVVMQRDRRHQKDFGKAIQASFEKVEAFCVDLGRLQELLPAQQSLATLQGVESKCKKLAALFHVDCLQEVEALERYTMHEPHKLFQLNGVLLKATRLFEDGGDFSGTEKEWLREKVTGLAERVRGSVKQRLEKVDELRETQARAATGLRSFHEVAAQCLEDLSLMYGLGMKYGAPRRNAQEQLRTEQTRDEREAARVDALLGALEATCDEVRHASDELGEEAATAPKSRVLLALLQAIRTFTRRRASYLNFLPQPDKVPLQEADPLAQTSVPESAEEPAEDEVVEVDADDALELDDVTAALVAMGEPREGTLAELVDAVEESCKLETKELYTSEGKEDRLGEDGVPESLRKWLAESRRKVLGEDGYREKAARKLRAQVHCLEALVAKAPVPPDPEMLGAPAAVIADLVHRSKAEANAARAATAQKFGKAMRAWTRKRDAHRSALRPQLGRPDARADLTQLCEAESVRREEVKAAVADARETVVKDAAVVARRFVSRLAKSTTEACATLDGLTYADDLGWLPGDENIYVKRKSLKRLRKMRRLAGPDAEGEILQETGLSFGEGRGRRFQARSWPGVDATAMARVESGEAVSEEPADDAGEAPPADAEPTESPEEAKLEGPWATVVARAGEPCDALVTTAHRVFVKARDAAFAEYYAYYESSNADMLAHYDALVAEEESWHGSWESLVKSLVIKSS